MVNWEAVGAIAERTGAIGVILSLVYLALQIRQNTTQMENNASLMRAESERAVKTHGGHFNLTMANSKQLSGVFRRGLENFDALEPDEQVQFSFFFAELLSAMDLAFAERSTGVGGTAAFDAHLRGVRPLLLTPGGRSFWRIYGGRSGSREFQQYIDSEVFSADQVGQASPPSP